MDLAQKLITQFNKPAEELLQLLSGLSQEELNLAPFADSWTAGQLGEHLYKSYAVVDTLNGSVRPANRSADEKVEEIEKLFLNFNIRMKSPEAILPTHETIEKEWLLPSLKERIDQLKAVIRHKDLTEICLDFIIPEYGEFTRLEWIHFNIVHTQRHIHQLKNIIKNVKAKIMDEKEKFLRDFNEAFARSDTDYLVNNTTEDIRWRIIGDKEVEGRKAFAEALKQMENPEPLDLEIHSVIIRENEAAVNGVMRMPVKGGKGQSYAFCDVYQFDGIQHKVKEMTSYVLEVQS